MEIYKTLIEIIKHFINCNKEFFFLNVIFIGFSFSLIFFWSYKTFYSNSKSIINRKNILSRMEMFVTKLKNNDVLYRIRCFNDLKKSAKDWMGLYIYKIPFASRLSYINLFEKRIVISPSGFMGFDHVTNQILHRHPRMVYSLLNKTKSIMQLTGVSKWRNIDDPGGSRSFDFVQQ